MTPLKSPKCISLLDIRKIKLGIIVSIALLILSLYQLTAHPQEVRTKNRIKITSPAGGSFDADDKVFVKGTAELADKHYLWLLVKQIKSGSKKLIYLYKLKVDSETNKWNHRIALEELEDAYDVVTLPLTGEGHAITDAQNISLEILVIVVDDVQHKKLDLHLTDKLMGNNKILVPLSAISKDKLEINVKYP